MVIFSQEVERKQEFHAINPLQCCKDSAEQVLSHYAHLIFGVDVCCLQLSAQGRHLVQGHQVLFSTGDAVNAVHCAR